MTIKFKDFSPCPACNSKNIKVLKLVNFRLPRVKKSVLLVRKGELQIRTIIKNFKNKTIYYLVCFDCYNYSKPRKLKDLLVSCENDLQAMQAQNFKIAEWKHSHVMNED